MSKEEPKTNRTVIGVSNLRADKNAHRALFFLVIQQVFVSVSIYLTISISTKISLGELLVFDVVALCVAMALPFGFGIVANFFSDQWAFSASHAQWAKYRDFLIEVCRMKGHSYTPLSCAIFVMLVSVLFSHFVEWCSIL